MINAILGTKKKMGQSFVKGTRVPVTYIKAGPCLVTQVKSEEKDGYWAVQLGVGEKKTKNITKPMKGHLSAASKKSKKAPRFLREIRLSKKTDLKVGDEVEVSEVFKKGDVVSVTGVGKGKGFAGVVKRWKFGGGPRTHGQSDRLRAPGSIGQGTDPGRVWKGKKMAGRMGSATTTVKNLIVMEIDSKKNELVLSGPTPGKIGSLTVIKKISSGKLGDLVEETHKEVVQQEAEEDEEEEKNEN